MTALVRNVVRTAFYLDSVALMRLSAQVSSLQGVEEAVLMIGTDANKSIMRAAQLLTEDGDAATPRDLVVAVRANDEDSLSAAFASAADGLNAKRTQRDGATADNGSASAVRTLAAGIEQLPDANLALISTPAAFAVREARGALARGLNVMLFSDNIDVADEVALKRQAHDSGLIVMGPDCGTAYVGGTPIAFANAIDTGSTGVIAASGTGLQEFAVLLDRAGLGLSHGIGVGGRDMSDAVGAISTLDAIEWLEADTNTDRIVLISKPPGAQTISKILGRLARASKPVFACFLGLDDTAQKHAAIPISPTLEELARAVIADGGVTVPAPAALLSPTMTAGATATGWRIDGLYSGGTLCAEAQVVMQTAGLNVSSNAPLNVGASQQDATYHRVLDLGADEFTQGRAHPMLEPSVRAEPMAESLADPQVAVLLVDVVLGFGAHDNPAAAIVDALAAVEGDNTPVVIAHVCGTERDPQQRSAQVQILRDAGVVVAESNVHAVTSAIAAVQRTRQST